MSGPPAAPATGSPASSMGASVRALKAFSAPRPPGDFCELCAQPLPARHEHLLEPHAMELKCSCGTCALLFRPEGRAAWRRVPVRDERLPGFVLTDSQWAQLQLPIELAFFVKSSVGGEVRAFFPSPAGATQALLPKRLWEDLCVANPRLSALEEDVEALLVQRLERERVAYLVSIDLCYELVGILRTSWRGLSGGTEAWEAISAFFGRRGAA